MNAATFVGIRTAGALGASVSTFARALPSWAIVVVPAKFCYRNLSVLQCALAGLPRRM